MFKKILVALDGSDLSEQIIAMVQQFHLQAETTVVLAHVIVNLGADPDIAVDRPQADTETISHQQLEKLQYYQSLLPCQSEIEIVMGEPAEEIIRLANIHQVDLIVMGSRGLTGIKRILQGSVSSQVVEEAPCSVFVVKLK
ncbi:MAG: universal stress protein [Leptolyngbya sp. IPPAS B-1204]|uniref:Universal stress protein n=1 Tax=Leptolyngbya sp. NK1-12 TaxID=2547451 RepID=A0AA96WMI0_9CYAN|nr:universal stress protein [Leptolyngbya sp. NK1-12]MBF2048398.1 universal stress protein [Elainella sp. C42_A2020_010]RNJ66587.1 MAG: universal stress protein [Leptolyngbya sp. IPPAS B-1204]WNZ25101.1 universal stress protein [Leptolyngbya sp. NK1-12]